ncbi:MAG TPA: GNAT family N-acetyltransferase [Lacipirellula sp.]
MPRPPVQVIRCPPRLRPLALKQLHSVLPGDQQAVFAQIISGFDPADAEPWDGLLVATTAEVQQTTATAAELRGPRFHAVVWVQRAPGNTAVIWSPPTTAEPGTTLLRAAADYLDAHNIPLAQMVAGEQDGYDDAIQAQCGFPRFIRLAYLFAEVPECLDASPFAASATEDAECEGLHFVPRAGQQPQRLAAVLEQTYIDTLDCPALEGVRPMNEVLDGYRAQGRYWPDDWYFVQENGQDIGALLLAEHPGHGNWELVYMGLVPQARGRNCGMRIIRFALETVAKRGAERLVLAVDEANTPALDLYERAGFVMWDRRIVYARLRPRA